MTDLFVLLGRPVEHSVSPLLHTAAFRAAAIDARYVALEVRDFDAAWAAVRRLGIRGGNVTVPWKEAALRVLDRPSPSALRARAANTFWRSADGRVAGTQTDGEGFLRALQEEFGRGAAGLRVLVLGAGGSARSVLHALGAAGAAALRVWARRPDHAAALAKELGAAGYRACVEVASGAEADLVVNATSASLSDALPDGLPLMRSVRGLSLAMDLVYAREPTPFVRELRRVGVQAVDGRVMLLHQAALAFEQWFERPAPLDAMRDALGRALAC